MDDVPDTDQYSHYFLLNSITIYMNHQGPTALLWLAYRTHSSAWFDVYSCMILDEPVPIRYPLSGDLSFVVNVNTWNPLPSVPRYI